MVQQDIQKRIESNTPYVIAEVGLNHNGALEIAKKLIDIAAEAKVDAVKFQKRTVDKLAIASVLDAKDNRFPEFGKTYREIREHIELSAADYRELKQYTHEQGLDFIVTAFDTDAVDFLEDLGVDAYKLASHSLTNIELLDYLARLRKPTILSTGMAEWDEIDRAVDIFARHQAPLSLMHCVSTYPTPLEECNLAVMNNLKQRYRLPVGYSGHELGYLPTIVAVALGAQLIERHFTLDKTMVGFDHRISLEPEELCAMVRDIRDVVEIKGSGEKKVTETELITRRKYHVSMVSAVPIVAGTRLTTEMISYRNPGTGIPPKLADKVIGKQAVCDISADELLTVEMFGDAI